jgi:excisionase family DNA binding protein
MAVITTKEAAARLGISAKRVQALVKAGRLPAKLFGGVYMIEAADLKLVKNRKTGRPKALAKTQPKK